MCVCLEPSGGRGAVLRSLSDSNDQMGKKIKPPKNLQGFKQNPKNSLPGPKFNQQKNPVPSHKNFQQALNDITIINLQIVLNTQNNLYVNQTAEKILAKIFLLKQIQESKIEIRSTPLPPHARWGLERACQHLRNCNCLPNCLESNSR